MPQLRLSDQATTNDPDRYDLGWRSGAGQTGDNQAIDDATKASNSVTNSRRFILAVIRSPRRRVAEDAKAPQGQRIGSLEVDHDLELRALRHFPLGQGRPEALLGLFHQQDSPSDSVCPGLLSTKRDDRWRRFQNRI